MDFDYVLQNCHWITKVSDTEYDLILDHHSLSTFRACEQMWVHDHVEGWQTKNSTTPWFFAIGITLHDCLEKLYEMKQGGNLDIHRFIYHVIQIWDKNNMDQYSGKKEYNAMGGKPGFIAMMTQYATFYNSDMERFRIIATEVPFGPGKEVPLGSFLVYTGSIESGYATIQVNCYLAGRIDFVMDNGRYIAPMDHKSMAYIDGDPNAKYDPQDGMTGYVYATREIVKNKFPELFQQRTLNRIWMNYLGVAHNTDMNKRFKRLPLDKTDWQLEEYRKRQLTTFRRIFELCYFDQDPQWNTGSCSNMFRRDCKYKYLHQRKDIDTMFNILQTEFVKRPVWNPDMSHEETKEE